ncbi:MAG: 2,3-bisphosphoglycerate-independent phosphoglycerate mutase [Pikeienuella sp.]
MSLNAPKPVVLIILDGWGTRADTFGNAVAQAHTPSYDGLAAGRIPATLACSGPDVGLPEGQMGNSEVGHTNIGAGRVVWMDLPKIDGAIKDGTFATNAGLTNFINKMKSSGGTAHLMGVMSPGGVHAHQRHIAEAARCLTNAGVLVALHLFLDGRDTPPKSAETYLRDFKADLGDAGQFATVTGRFYALDRDNRWERVESAYNAIVKAEGRNALTPELAISEGYERGGKDEFIAPTVIDAYQGMSDGDGVMFMNFRADRAREILAALGDPAFTGFDRGQAINFAAMLGIVEYSNSHNTYMETMFPPADIANTLGEWVAKHDKRQLRLAETEKYPHVTFFLNGGAEAPYAGEVRYMAQSPKVKTYDLAPEMAAAEVTRNLVDAIAAKEYDLIVVNYANPDMVGHTGDLNSAIKACEAVDRGLGAALRALAAVGGAAIVTADHGNCEQMIDPETGGAHTAHTTTPVAALLAGGPGGSRLEGQGRLADLAPTLLDLMGMEQPPEMSGRSLLKRI